MAKIIVGLSGGVDSAVAALLLKEAGHEVLGVTLRTWGGDENGESRCCEIDDAREAADKIGIPYHVFNCIPEFEKNVVRPFIRDYISGRTPNPCVICNRRIKWEYLMYYAKVLGAEFVATGHYAFVEKAENGRYTVRRALHAEKDQTYMLYRLSQEQLQKTLMPLGNLSKQDVRERAEKAGLRIASKPDSQEICFVPDGHYTEFIEKNAGVELPGPGRFVNEKGEILGTHEGIVRYTVGQRKGLGIALGYPAYVKEIRPETNEIVLGDVSSLRCGSLVCDDVSFMSIPGMEDGERLPCTVKVRYHHEGQDAMISPCGSGGIRVDFASPVRSASPGQSAVFYDDRERVIGGGIISRTVHM